MIHCLVLVVLAGAVSLQSRHSGVCTGRPFDLPQPILLSSFLFMLIVPCGSYDSVRAQYNIFVYHHV